MTSKMNVLLWNFRNFNSKAGEALAEISGLNFDTKEFFVKILSHADWQAAGLEGVNVYAKNGKLPLIALSLDDNGFSKKIVGSEVIGELEIKIKK